MLRSCQGFIKHALACTGELTANTYGLVLIPESLRRSFTFLDPDGGDTVTSTSVFSCEAFGIVFSLKLHLSLKNALPL